MDATTYPSRGTYLEGNEVIYSKRYELSRDVTDTEVVYDLWVFHGDPSGDCIV